jgi:hypothetical protein
MKLSRRWETVGHKKELLKPLREKKTRMNDKQKNEQEIW